jgi:hypothetical protein
MFIVWFLTVFLVLFPKGGLKIGILPLTWGYLFLALTTPPLLLVRLAAFPSRLLLRVWVVLGAVAPIQLLCIYAMVFYGIVDPPFAVSTLTNLFFLPWIFLLVYPPFLGYVDGERLSRYLRVCIFLTAVWGIFLFFWHPFTGHFIEIPYLTVNVADYGDLEYTKHIARGLFLKLISTYNNGNLYGVAMLILLPLYEFLEKARWRVWLLKGALVLTLSRTVWFGLVIVQLAPLGLLLMRQVATFPRLQLGRLGKQVIATLVIVGCIFGALLFNSSTLAFLFDPNLGGRLGGLGAFSTATLLPSRGLAGLSEVVYVSAATWFGYAGFVAITLLLWSPALLLFVDSSALRSPSRTAALKGLLMYAVLCVSDGGFNYLPVMAFYWFAYMVYLFGWPAATSVVPRRVHPVLIPAAGAGDSLPIVEGAH